MMNNHGGIALFFTYGVSLDIWHKKGMMARELRLYTELAKERGPVYFLTYGRHDLSFKNSVGDNIIILPKKYNVPDWIYSLVLPFVYRRELKSARWYKTNQMLGSWSAILAGLIFRKPVIVRTGYTLGLFADTLLKKIIARSVEMFAAVFCDKLVVATEEDREYFSKFKKTRVEVVPNYVDTDSFRPTANSKITKTDKTILYVGRLSAQKNLAVLFDALAGTQGVILKIIGSGELESELKKKASALGLKAIWLGNLSHDRLPEEMNTADLFVLPSLYEGNPKVLLEAMSCGCPIVAANTPGIKSLIQDGVTGLLAEPTAESLRNAILHALAHESEGREMAVSAREYVVKQNSFPVIFSKELAHYAF